MLSRLFKVTAPVLRMGASPRAAVVARCVERGFPYSRLFSSAASPNVLVLADHNNQKLAPGTRSAITAAKAIGAGNVTVAVVGSQCASVADAAARLDGVNKVLLVDDQTQLHPIAESLVPIIRSIHESQKFTHILAPSNSTSKSALPRLAAKLDVAPISDITAVKAPDTFVRPIYAGNALATVRSKDAVKIITVRSTSFEKTGESSSPAPVSSFTIQPSSAATTTWEGAELTKSERPELTAANIVVSGGRGLKSAENFKMLDELASLLNAAVGASRAAVDAGYAPNDMQVGQTGKVVAPDLYIAIGISGAIQHLAGMKDSKVIVAINKDAEAPIFQVSDYGLVADLFQVVPEMTQALKSK